jgi:cobalt/nickel transport system permease protein
LKLAALFFLLIYISLAAPVLLGVGAVALAAMLAFSGLPVVAILTRCTIVLPFSAAAAAILWLAGDPARAGMVLAKSYLSALSALLFAATTPLPSWTAALRSWGVSRALVSTLEFVYRYLFVIAEEAGTMSIAAEARGGFRFQAAAGALAVLFARSWRRAEAVHRARLARGAS